MSITGIRFRPADDGQGGLGTGRLILQVCEHTNPSQYQKAESVWRDAKTEDLLLVAGFTRAHDALIEQIEAMRLEVESLRRERASGFGQDKAMEWEFAR